MIITNAHVVREATTVRVRRHGDSEKFNARIMVCRCRCYVWYLPLTPHLVWHGQCVNHACDLAILSVADPEFWANIKPLAISPIIPHLFENVVVVGFPMGGDNICVTRGVVSRVTTLSYQEPKYYDPGPEIMAIQIDAAINSGNSGGWVPYRSGAVEGFCLASYSPLLFLSPPGGARLC